MENKMYFVSYIEHSNYGRGDSPGQTCIKEHPFIWQTKEQEHYHKRITIVSWQKMTDQDIEAHRIAKKI
jgi:hypothetical protein